MQKPAPIEDSEGDADADQSWRQVHGMIPLTQSKMHAVPTPAPAPAPEPPLLPRRSALAIEILSFVLIAFLVVSALLFNLTAPRPVASVSPAVSVPLPPKPSEPAASAAAPAPVVQEAPPAEPEPAVADSLSEVRPQAGPPPSAPPAESETARQPEPRAEVAALPPPDAPVLEDAAPAAVSETVPPPPAPADETASLPLPADEAEALIRRGDELLAIGDIVAARAAYERAAAGGNRLAAIGAAKTYDPIYLAQSGVRGLRGDPARAALWYGRAAAAGDHDAQQRLRRLRAQYPQ